MQELYRMQLQDYRRRRAQPQMELHGETTAAARRSQSIIPFVNLVDDDDDDEAAAGDGAGKELDLELRL